MSAPSTLAAGHTESRQTGQPQRPASPWLNALLAGQPQLPASPLAWLNALRAEAVERVGVLTLLAFTAHHVQRLTGLSARQLGYWDRTGFFSPQHISLTRSHPFGRIYSFRDVVGDRKSVV